MVAVFPDLDFPVVLPDILDMFLEQLQGQEEEGRVVVVVAGQEQVLSERLGI